MMWNKETLDNCISLQEKDQMKLCEGMGLIMSGKVDSCEISAVKNQKKLSKECAVKEMLTPDVWLIETETVNQWLYVVEDSRNVW